MGTQKYNIKKALPVFTGKAFNLFLLFCPGIFKRDRSIEN